MIGLNGTGKSSLMKALAGVDREHDGGVWRKEGLVIGYLEQEPTLDPEKDVLGNVMDGLGERKTLMDKFNEVSAAMGDPDADFDKLVEQQGKLQNRIDELDCWNVDHEIAVAMEALRVPDGTRYVEHLSGGEIRRVA